MGGGEKPPMDVLKNWMYEQVSVNEASIQVQSHESVHIQSQSHESVQLQLNPNMTPDSNQLNNVLGLVNLPISAHQDSAQFYNWNNAQYVPDQEPYELMDNTGAIVDESLIQAYATPFLT
jgi:hypothetical protein